VGLLNVQCRADKANGEPCTLPANGPDGYCWAHSPQHAERRRRTASRAGKAKANKEVSNLKDEVKVVIAGVESGSIDRSDGAVMLQGYRVLKDLVELGRKVKETDELLERVAVLERGREREQEKGARPWQRP
jgi:hypothetical protein